MDHYLDIRLLPCAELASAHLMGALFGRLHAALAARGKGDVGVSFPAVQPQRPWLGDCLRLHGDVAALDTLMASPWMAQLRDYTHVSHLSLVPPDAMHRCVRRVQPKSSAERIRRRQMRRHGYDAEEARRRVPDDVEQTSELPYVTLASASTGQSFRLFIAHGPLGNAAQHGSFSAYGLSAVATVPWF